MSLEVDRPDKVTETPPAPVRNIYRLLLENHGAGIINGTLLNGEDAVHNLKLCAASHESARKGGKKVYIC